MSTLNDRRYLSSLESYSSSKMILCSNMARLLMNFSLKLSPNSGDVYFSIIISVLVVKIYSYFVVFQNFLTTSCSF